MGRRRLRSPLPRSSRPQAGRSSSPGAERCSDGYRPAPGAGLATALASSALIVALAAHLLVPTA
ncbi:hypothetical protein [Streptomyces somaliensis]|uniref:hypothetical protein n=1 Tax=Streptomyces somaliensis TaxID=78355 RepID=UPI0034E97B6D